MPYKEKDIQKRYYSISEVATILDVNASLIRFWEKEFDTLKPKKNKKGNRLFTPDDLVQLKTIYHLVKRRGFTLEGARNMMKSKGKEVKDQAEIQERLEKVRAFLLELKDNL